MLVKAIVFRMITFIHRTIFLCTFLSSIQYNRTLQCNQIRGYVYKLLILIMAPYSSFQMRAGENFMAAADTSWDGGQPREAIEVKGAFISAGL